MKTACLLLLTLFLTCAVLLPNTSAHPRDDAKASLGIGSMLEATYSPDGTRLVAASSIGIWIYDAQTGKALHLLTGHLAPVNSVCFSPDGKTIASASGDETVRLWDATTGQHISTLSGLHRSSICSVCFSPDGKTIATASGLLINEHEPESHDNEIKLWDATTGQHLKRFVGHTMWVNSICFSPDGKTIASASQDGTIRLWDVD